MVTVTHLSPFWQGFLIIPGIVGALAAILGFCFLIYWAVSLILSCFAHSKWNGWARANVAAHIAMSDKQWSFTFRSLGVVISRDPKAIDLDARSDLAQTIRHVVTPPSPPKRP